VTVIDAGRGPELLDFLIRNKISKVDILILSHADEDHIAGVMGVLNTDEIEIDNVYLNTDSSKGSDIWDDLAYTLHNYHKLGEIKNFSNYITPNLNGKLNRGEITVEVLGPNSYIAAKGPGSTDRKGRKITTNSISAAIRLLYKNKPIVILPGDIDDLGLSYLLEDCNDIKAWLAVFPHHGGYSGKGEIVEFTSCFCSYIRPEIIVFSIGRNIKDFPNKHVVDTIATAYQDVTMLSTGHSETFEAYIKDNSICTHRNSVGTITIKVDVQPPAYICER
jgi:competence protein ComEC